MKLIVTDLPELPVPVEGEHRVISPRGEIHPCTGCFGCWVRTPGRCVIRDGFQDTGIRMGGCHQLVLVSRCCYGSLSPFVKAVQDRAIPYLHPDFVLRGGELHHRRRYRNVITLSVWLYGEDITGEERQTARDILRANAENYGGRVGEVRFFDTPEQMGGMML